MDKTYFVSLMERETKKIFSLLCSQNDLRDLMVNIDSDKYDLGEIQVMVTEKSVDFTQFCKKDDNLETGKV